MTMEEKLRNCMEKAESCFSRLQGIDITATLDNMEKLVQSLYEIRDIYSELGAILEEFGGEEDGRETGPERRDDD